MSTLAIIASIALAAPAADATVQLPTDAFLIVGSVTKTLLPAGLRESLDSNLSDPRSYESDQTRRGEPQNMHPRTVIAQLRDALATRAPDKVVPAIAHCVRVTTLAALRSEIDTAGPLITAHHARLMFETRVDPGRLLGEPSVETLWEKIISGPSTPLSQFKPDDLDERLSTVELRLEIAALLSAKMIRTAWRESDKPSLARAKPAAATKAQNEMQYVASKNSKVYHKATCPHVSRIKKSNLIRFKSINKARATGRKPCKTCKPEG